MSVEWSTMSFWDVVAHDTFNVAVYAELFRIVYTLASDAQVELAEFAQTDHMPCF